jgi:GDP-mannose 6-dehydrogenase
VRSRRQHSDKDSTVQPAAPFRVSVFGLGYVGSVTAACLAAKGHRVIGVETNPDKLALLRQGQAPLFEPKLAPLLEDVHRSGWFTATDSAAEAVADSDLSFICVGTPSQKGGRPDLTHIRTVCREIGQALGGKRRPHTIVVRSTMLPGSIETLLVPALEEASGQQEGVGFHVVANPEFMREGSAIQDFYAPPFVIVGEIAPGAGDELAALYRCVDAPQIRCSIRAAEAIKFACNAFHAVKVTFANELGQFCKAQGIDSREVMAAFCRDTKLNVSKAYLRPGLAYGGSCLPKDLRALVGRAREHDVELPMLEGVARSNAQQIERAVELIAGLGRRRVGILGLSFKAGTDDLRESPVVLMAEALLGKGFDLRVHDSEVELTRLLGANKRFLDEKLPHISSLLLPSLPDVLGRSEVVVLCKQTAEYADLGQRLGPDQQLVDLIGALPWGADARATYHGLYW